MKKIKEIETEVKQFSEEELKEIIKNQCPECSSNNTVVKENELFCNVCCGSFVKNEN